MTKIKNTKKGMAKKTLSMSLVVAMLATSNVPVWAAEFSDGSDINVATETPSVEATDEFSDAATQADGVDEAPAVDDTDVAAAQGVADHYVSTIEAPNIAVGGVLSYTGEITLKGRFDSYTTPTWYGPDGKEVTPGSENQLYATKEGVYQLKTTITYYEKFKKYTETVVLTEIKVAEGINDGAIQGTVSMSNDAANQWGYENKANYSAEVPDGVTLAYAWQTYDEDNKEWKPVQGYKTVENGGDKYTTKIDDYGKELRVVAKFTNSKNDQVIKEVASEKTYKVAPLQISAQDIKVDKAENFGMDKVNTEPKVNSVTVSKEGVLKDKKLTPDDYALNVQNTDTPGIRTVTVQLKGAYEGEVTETVNLSKNNLDNCDVTLESDSVEFVGDGQYATPTIKKVTWADGYATLKEGTDYVIASKKLDKSETAKFGANVNYIEDCITAGKDRKVDLIGRGRFTGTKKTVTFNIVSRSMENCKVVWTGKPVTKGEPLVGGVDVKDTTKTHFVVVDQKGYVLKPDIDYTYKKDGIYDVSGQKCQVEVFAKGKKGETGGNYYGSTKSDFTTVGTNLTTYLTNYVASVVSAQEYTGKEITFDRTSDPAKRLDKINAWDVAMANGGY